MAKSLQYWSAKWRESPQKTNQWKALDLLAAYVGYNAIHINLFGIQLKFYGWFIRFIKGIWRHNHINEVWSVIKDFYITNKYLFLQNHYVIEFVLAMIKQKIGNKYLNPFGDLYQIMRVIDQEANICYELIDAEKTLQKYQNVMTPRSNTLERKNSIIAVRITPEQSKYYKQTGFFVEEAEKLGLMKRFDHY